MTPIPPREPIVGDLVRAAVRFLNGNTSRERGLVVVVPFHPGLYSSPSYDAWERIAHYHAREWSAMGLRLHVARIVPTAFDPEAEDFGSVHYERVALVNLTRDPDVRQACLNFLTSPESFYVEAHLPSNY